METEIGIVVGTTNFGIGTVAAKREGDTFSLSITGDEATSTRIRNDENHPFHWIIYPPRFYADQINIAEKDGSIQINIDEDMLDEYDIALYLVEHNDVYGTLTLSADNAIRFEGTVFINGQKMPLRIVADAGTLKNG